MEQFKYRNAARFAAYSDVIISGVSVAILVEELVVGIWVWSIELAESEHHIAKISYYFMAFWIIFAIFAGYPAVCETWSAVIFLKATNQEMIHSVALKKAKTWRHFLVAFFAIVVIWALVLKVYLFLAFCIIIRGMMLYIAWRFIKELENSDMEEL